ncbi:MAG: hypothetical protein ACK52U_03870, partial [Synechococcaceae cyanobacterium]
MPYGSAASHRRLTIPSPHPPTPDGSVENRSFTHMFDAFTKVVAQADARGEFLNAGQIDALSAVV